jgi:outer membrane protein, heavy metal efflux system
VNCVSAQFIEFVHTIFSEEKIMYRFSMGCALIVAVLVTAPAWCQDGGDDSSVLTLRQAFELALKGSPELATYDWDMRIAEARRLQASLRPNPELSLEIEEVRLTDGPNSVTTFGTEREVEGGTPAGFGDAEFTLRFSQLIELAGKRVKRMRSAELMGDVFRREYEIARADVLARVASLFTDVLGAQERVRLSGETLTLALDVQKVIAARVRAGQVSPIEQTRAEVQVSQARIELERVERDLAALRFQLAASWGDEVPTFSKAVGMLEAPGEILGAQQLKMKISDSPDLMFWTAELNQLEAEVIREKSLGKPDLGVTVGYRARNLESRRISRFDTGSVPPDLLGTGRSGYNDGRDDTFVLEFSLPLPLFNRNQGNVREAEYQVLKASARGRATAVRIRSRIDASYENMKAAQDEVAGLRGEVLPKAESAYNDTNKGYIAGKFGYLDVLDAQRTLVGARDQYLSALVEYHQARIRLERLAGIDISSTSGANEEVIQGVNQ